MSDSGDCPVQVNTTSHWAGGQLKSSAAVGFEPVIIKKEPVERDTECDGSTASPQPRPSWSGHLLPPPPSRFEKSLNGCNSKNANNAPTIEDYRKSLSLGTPTNQSCFNTSCEKNKSPSNGQNSNRSSDLESTYQNKDSTVLDKNIQDINKYSSKIQEIGCYNSNFVPSNSINPGQSFGQKDVQSNFGQLFLQPYTNVEAQKTTSNCENFYSRYENTGKDLNNFQGDMFGRHCGSYAAFLNHHQNENVEKETGFFQYPHVSSINIRETNISEDIPGKGVYPSYLNGINDTSFNKDHRNTSHDLTTRKDSVSKFLEFAPLKSAKETPGSISSSKPDHITSYSVQSSSGINSKRDQNSSESRANVLVSPGNSCIVSSTNTSGGMRNFGGEEVTGSIAENAKSEWAEKPASVSSSRQELVVSSSTRCDSSAPLPLPRTDIVSTTAPVSGVISNPPGSGARRGALQLWQFLVALLDEPSSAGGCIAWTGRGLEFKLLEPEEVARRWGVQKNRPAMNYDKLSRSLRYYYEKGIMQKVAGERYVYKFVCDPDALFNMAYGPHHAPPPETTNLHHPPPKSHQPAKSTSATENPENLCLKQNANNFHQGNINNNIPPDSKPHQNFTHHHQNYDLFPGFYNTNHHHLNYPPAHFSIHPSLQQYIATPGGHFANHSGQIGANFESHHQEQNGFQHGDHTEANGGHNWNVSRYYHHQNQIGYDG